MDDYENERAFERAMEGFRVRAIHAPTPRRKALEVAASDEGYRKAEEEFEAAMAESSPLPNKDAPPKRVETPRTFPTAAARPKAIRVTYSERAGLRAGASLDLHGLTVAQMERDVRRFVEECAAVGCRVALLITGKGVRSKEGQSVLRPAVGRWIESEGRRWISAFGDAPRYLGGEGAVVIEVRPASGDPD